MQQTLYHNPQPYLKSANAYSEEAYTEWLEHENTTELLQTDVYEVHIDQVSFASFDIQSHVIRDKYFVGNSTFWGITNDWDDYLTRQLRFTPTDEADGDDQ